MLFFSYEAKENIINNIKMKKHKTFPFCQLSTRESITKKIQIMEKHITPGQKRDSNKKAKLFHECHCPPIRHQPITHAPIIPLVSNTLNQIKPWLIIDKPWPSIRKSQSQDRIQGKASFNATLGKVCIRYIILTYTN